MYFVYVLRSEKSNKYYVGYTKDIEKRLRNHNSGGNKSTRASRPWVVAHLESFSNKRSAWLRERQIKRYKGGEAFKKLISGGVAERSNAAHC